jgi:vacuolar-type H+-ATPase subunit I/STV1
MRYLRFVTALAWLGVGCAGIPPARLEAQVLEAERWRREYEAERERTEVLAARLAALESAMERLALERAEAEQGRAVVLEELVRTEADRHALEEHNTQLLALERQLNELKELKEMHEELSDVWYESALERARRRMHPQRESTPPAASGTAAP